MSHVRIIFCISDCADEEDDGVGNEGEGERTFPKKAKWQ
jgi:hypothetical protein